MSEEYFDLIVDYENDIKKTMREYQAACYQIIDEHLAILHISRDKIESCQDLYKTYKVFEVPKLYGLYGKSSLEASGILIFHYQPFVALRGQGVLLGFVDTGIDYTHQVFKYEDNTTKINSIWDQTIQGNPPEGYLYGTKYNMEEINQALQSDNPFEIVPHRDELGHGTFAAGIAGGREDETADFVGAAPDAEIIMVKLKQSKKCNIAAYYLDESIISYQETDIIMGLRYLVEESKMLQKPIAINIGLGSNMGTHDGETITEKYLEKIVDNIGVGVVICAGNEANTGRHYEGFIEMEGSSMEVEFNVGKNEVGLYFTLMANAPDIISIALTSPTGDFISRTSPLIRDGKEVELILEKTKIYIGYDVAVFGQGDELVYVFMEKPTEGIWSITVYGDIIVNGRFDIWLPREGWVRTGTRFLEPNQYTTVTIPSTSVDTITIGAYNHISNALYIQSGRGLTRDLEQKPDVVAPGVDVYGPVPGGKFGVMTGTSVASAHASGAAALLLEWGIVLGNDNSMNTGRIKSWFIRGAKRRGDLVYPNREWGYGELNLSASFDILRGIRFD